VTRASEASGKGTYSLEIFRDVAARRAKEAKHLLEASKRSCDGAVACALLATECALKATLLFGYEVTYDHELPERLYIRYFRSKHGHALMELYREQHPRVSRRETAPFVEVTRLDGRDRYEHRYGACRPRPVEARPIVVDAETVVGWMWRIVS